MKPPVSDLFRAIPQRVALRDVTLRDGLQTEKVRPELEARVALVRRIRAAGIREMEITAFVHPGKVPAMADAEKIWEALSGEPDLTCSALVFNRKGLERALRCGVGRIAVFVSASEAHSRSNTGKGVQEALGEAVEVLEEAKVRGLHVRAGVASAFGCNMEGAVEISRVRSLLEAFSPLGPDEAALADTSGSAHPGQILERVQLCRDILGECPLSLHLHDAGGWAFANLLAALQVGVEIFDVTVGGLGGCPFLPGAAGNLPAERVVRFLDAMGVETGVDAESLGGPRQRLEQILGRALDRG